MKENCKIDCTFSFQVQVMMYLDILKILNLAAGVLYSPLTYNKLKH